MVGAPSLASYILKSKSLTQTLMPLAKTYARLAGYRKMGLKYDDLLPEENDTMQKAIKRLPERESYDRAFRLRQALQLSAKHHLLPEQDWVKPGEDTRYMTPLAEEVAKEASEREEFDTLKVQK
ncbi:ubiquinol-cytochrome c reductase complex 14 kDa protein [Protomyces lactucae-debilis]|uniref:Cytochrome b-c1 complex subunit 7 n=1 Tax=Protomyces lactucae-debilis TaxID=2754530 RepID=A0A1Y2FCE4_PROLT|nr:ubiquinol-cytochrome c reductase complex 14 kDa protein [Protomyces lactucae-debilis]ORY80986.1 ubiquinol-cytochrome c reductase complex 14 kDa protein [Protomyces lactucae-debilis]